MYGHPSPARDSSAGLAALVGRQSVFVVRAEEITVMAMSLFFFPSDPRLDLIFPSSYNSADRLNC